MKKLDIDKLHKVYDYEYPPRGAGESTARCLEIIGHSENFKDIVVIIEYGTVLNNFKSLLTHWLTEMDMPWIHHMSENKVSLPGKSTVWFVPYDNVRRKTAGMHEHIIIDARSMTPFNPMLERKLYDRA